MAEDNVISLGDAKSAISALARLDPISYGQRRKDEAKRLGLSVSLLDKEVHKCRRMPTDPEAKNLILSDRGVIVPILANAVEILRQGAALWNLRFEEFSQRAFIGDKPLEDADLLRIAEWIQRKGCHAGRKVTDDAIIHLAHETRFHVVKDWLEPIKWDGVKRCDMLLIDHAGVEDTPLARAFTSKWLIQAIARVYRPGCQADATLVLEGPQGAGKSSLLRTLFGDDWFTDHLPNLDHKDAQIQLLGIWCIELAELAALSGKESAKTKQFLTSRDDRFRMPWDRIAKNHPRASVFAGTVNPGANGYMKDETGGRRYWPLVVGHVDVGAIAAVREQVWAEALHRYHDGENWHLGEGDLSDSAKAAQSDRFVTDPWQETISDFLRGKQWVTLAEIYKNCVEIPAVADWDQLTQTRISRCITHAGWVKKQRWIPTTLSEKPRREWGFRPETNGLSYPPPPDDDGNRGETIYDYNL